MFSTRKIVFLGFFLSFLGAYAHEHNSDSEFQNGSIRFSENKGQWNDNVLFRLRFKTGALFLEKNKFTYTFIDGKDWEKIYNAHHGDSIGNFFLKGHAFQVHFQNANPQVMVQGADVFLDYENYFIGNDQTKWASQVKVFHGAEYKNIYPNIDLVIAGNEGKLKYSFVVQPGGNPADIKMLYEGVEKIFIHNGELHYTTTVNSIHEEQPYSFQEIGGQKKEVASKFILRENLVSFDLGNYDSRYPLVIDPVLVFATYTGSLADNFGYTATYDNAGNLYAGGLARAAGYPTTVGAFQSTFGGGSIVGNFDIGYDGDIAITKFNSTGTAQIYSTYLGGSINEQPHSLVVNSNNELVVYGRSNSSNFPITVGAFDVTYNGGTDIIVSKFNATGTALIGSTFIGGSADDGANITTAPYIYSTLKFNYADDARGEVIVDAQDNIYVASCTRSTNFPASTGVFQTTLIGQQDGCIIKLNRDLTARIWATYLGGDGDDAAYSLVLDNQNRIYACGGTNSNNFPITPGSLITGALGGLADGFISNLSSDGTTLISGTYIGTNQYDQTFFVQLDGDQNVYVVGQTAGIYPVTPGVYFNSNSGQFITSLTPALNSIRFSTVFGKGDGNPDISLTAFLVDNCRNIYVSGWGGNTNNSVGSTFNLPTTADAFQRTTDGSDFYYFVLSKDAATLQYASFFGGTSSAEHVDGGTSRFDKNGVIYQAACAGCGGYNDFPTTPGVWSRTNQSQFPQRNCNLGAAKLEFQLIGVDVSVSASPATSGCVPHTVTLSANAVNAKGFWWDFGDGLFSNDTFPVHTYTVPGTYLITLIGIDSTTCDNQTFGDTSYLTINVDDDSLSADFIPVIVSSCDSFIVDFINTSVSVNPINDVQWRFGDGVTSTVLNPRHEYISPGTYNITMIVRSLLSCNPLDTIVKTITLAPFITAGISVDDTLGCVPFTTHFMDNSIGGVQYFWDFGDGDTSTLENSAHTFVDTGLYLIRLIIIDSASCNFTDTAFSAVYVSNDSIIVAFDMDTLANECDSLVIQFTNQSTGYISLLWDFGEGTTSTLENPVHTFSGADSFLVNLVAYNPSKCNENDTASEKLFLLPKVQALFDAPPGCPPFDVTINNISTNGLTYLWKFQDGSTNNDDEITYYGLGSGNYSLTLTAYNPNTCNDSDTYSGTFNVYEQAIAFFTTDSMVYQLFANVQFENLSTNADQYLWDFGDNDSSVLVNPFHTYDELGEYSPCLTASNNFGCDSIFCSKLDIYFNAVIDVPNAYSPNGDGINDILFVKGIGVKLIEFKIYNRWGELVFQTEDPGIVCNHYEDCVPSKGWDGTYKGTNQEMEVYVYTMKAVFEDGTESGLRKGNITLLR